MVALDSVGRVGWFDVGGRTDAGQESACGVL